jgi:hypothetical protein
VAASASLSARATRPASMRSCARTSLSRRPDASSTRSTGAADTLLLSDTAPGVIVTAHQTQTQTSATTTQPLIRVRVEIVGAQKCRIVGKSQSVLIMVNPIIFTRTRIPTVGVGRGACHHHTRTEARVHTPRSMACLPADVARDGRLPPLRLRLGGATVARRPRRLHHTGPSHTQLSRARRHTYGCG